MIIVVEMNGNLVGIPLAMASALIAMVFAIAEWLLWTLFLLSLSIL